MKFAKRMKATVEEAKALAKKLGLDKIDFDKQYSLDKRGAKKSSPYGYSDKMHVEKGDISLCSSDGYIWIVINGHGFNWFKTSPIVKFGKDGNTFLIETENSYYTLTEI